MRRPFSFLLSLFLILCFIPSALAQDFGGRWAGPMQTDEGPGGLEISLTRNGSQWQAAMKMRLEGQEVEPVVGEVQVNGSEISFTGSLGSTLVKFKGTFAGEQLNGTAEAFSGGRKVGEGIFRLTRNGEMPALPRQQQGGGQMADPDFDASVAHPAYTKKKHPKILFDEAHNNFHTASGRYKPFADLITNDGYEVVPNKQKFTRESLQGYKVLVISNALGAEAMNAPTASNPAFTDEECDAVRDWVRAGGSLLLIADHAPMGSANQILAKRFDVDMSKAYTVDQQNFDAESGNRGFIVYTRESGRLASHPVTEGRNAQERVNKVIAFTGQSLRGPAGSVAFMRLADTAQDVAPGDNQHSVSAAGRAQGIAMKFGKGRVIVMGEAGMLSAQIVGQQHMKFGMNRPGIDNRQLALNMMHWLSHLLN
ncbi:MAG TPA: hypothetical protein VK619_08290 [Pyrinomonadaceae bacterium]|nr:hypothetical protein [Pyrinomonadaceae bacterium]